MHPQAFSLLAEQLGETQELHNEALYRTIIGRYYYSAFHEVRYWLEHRFTNDYFAAEGNSHEKLTLCCYHLQRQQKDLLFSSVGRLLSVLKDRRVKADYALEIPCRFVDVKIMQTDYADFLLKFQELKLKYA